jgi:hypothetical protein
MRFGEDLGLRLYSFSRQFSSCFNNHDSFHHLSWKRNNYQVYNCHYFSIHISLEYCSFWTIGSHFTKKDRLKCHKLYHQSLSPNKHKSNKIFIGNTFSSNFFLIYFNIPFPWLYRFVYSPEIKLIVFYVFPTFSSFSTY